MTLLDDAAVRFDFSQYTDVDDMVDVNGGWGPVTPQVFTDSDVEFTADGMRIILGGTDDWMIEGSPSALILGGDGMTIMSVKRSDVPFDIDESGITGWDLVGDGLNMYAPELQLAWRAAPSDQYDVRVNDLGSVVIVEADQTGLSSGLDSRLNVGVFIAVQVVDPVAQECRINFVAPDARFDHAFAFQQPVPDFVGTPTVLDTIYYGTSRVSDDHTLVEWLGWNRALTEVEVEDLVAWFVDGTPLPAGDSPGGGSEDDDWFLLVGY